MRSSRLARKCLQPTMGMVSFRTELRTIHLIGLFRAKQIGNKSSIMGVGGTWDRGVDSWLGDLIKPTPTTPPSTPEDSPCVEIPKYGNTLQSSSALYWKQMKNEKQSIWSWKSHILIIPRGNKGKEKRFLFCNWAPKVLKAELSACARVRCGKIRWEDIHKMLIQSKIFHKEISSDRSDKERFK